MMADTVVPGRENSPDGPAMAAPPPRPSPAAGGRFRIIPLILVNLIAIWGQGTWAFETITRGGLFGAAVAVVFAGALETTGIFLAQEADAALVADLPNFGLRLGSYGMGGIAGFLSFLHFAPDGIAACLAFGLMSAVSPWLWAVRSKRLNRARLAELGLSDKRAPKLSGARKLLYPLRSLRVVRWAVWAGISDAAAAVQGWTAAAASPAGAAPDPETIESARDRILAAVAEHPEWTQKQVADHVRCSERWVRRTLSPIKAA